ncbi:hypothetical protein BXO88_08035 [Oribacterium sp. C9]|uniref:TasA family protein n=1 Tax=Oribacterium sp. C9 TaxID=1943579 RepID=UPI00098F445E|nr:TasA family protein [Oribacterium sp. C9]OON86453.1 hypothetical protein BXO88_08035 [Oribacterium sp. C9]
MKKKRIAAATISVLALISAITGSYAYFTDKKSIDISAKTTNLAIEVDDREFTNEKVKNMLPGDSRELSYTVTNVGKADALVISEITLISSVPMDDTVEWFIQDTDGNFSDEDRQVDPEMAGKDFVDEVTINEVMDSKIKFVSLTDDSKVAKFIVNNGVLARNQTSTVDLLLTLGLNAGNSFMDSNCEVIANVYGIQNENTDGALTWEFIKDTADANGQIENP